MYPGQSTPASIFKNTSLKRDKETFRMSTAAISATHGTVLREENYYPSSLHNRETILPHHEYERKNERKSYSKMTHPRTEDIKFENTNIYKTLLGVVNEEKNMPKDSYRATNHQTPSYISTGGVDQQENEKYQMTEEDNFPPSFIKKLYDEYQSKSEDGNVNFNNGNLEKSGFLYFSIEERLILVNSLYYLQEEGTTIEPIEITLPKHALAVKEILIADFDIDDISLHPFGQRSLILMIWFPWQVGFYAFEPDQLCKFIDLNMRFDASCEVAHHFDYSRNGEIFYMDETGEVGKIDLFYEKLWFFWGLKKYRIKEYLYHTSSNAKRKYTQEENQNIFEKIEEYYKNMRYLLSKKKRKGICLVCDRNRNYLFTLTETSLKNMDVNKEVISHREIKMYNISKDCYDGSFEKLSKSLYNYPPKEEVRFNEEELYKEIGSNVFVHLSLDKFSFFNIYVIENNKNSDMFYKKNEVNFMIVLRNGTRIAMHLSPDYFSIRSIVHLPNLEESLNIHKRTCEEKNYLEPTVIQQKEPENFRLVTEKYCERERSLVMMGVFNKRTVFLLFTAGLGDEHQEEVEIMWEENNEEKALVQNMFIFASNYKIFLGAELERNMYKHRLANYKYNQIEKRYYGNKTMFNKQAVEHVNVNKIKESPESRQVLHHPRQFLFVKENVVTGIMKLRFVDIVIGVLQREISNKNEESINGLLLSDFELVHLYRKIVNALKFKLEDRREKVELIAIFFQIFCDVDGVYFFNQFRITNMQRLSEGQTEERRSNMLSNNLLPNSRISKRSSESANFNSLNPENINGVNNANWRRRTSVKLKRNLKFIRCRRSELTVQGNEQFETLRSGNPIQDKADHSVLKLIFKLMIFSVKNWGEDLGNFKRETEWIYKSFGENEQLKCIEVEQAALKYISRLISPIWGSRLREISPNVFPYIADICKNMIELIKRIENELVANRIYYSLQEVEKLLSVMMEYNNMLSLLSFHPDLRYGEGLGCDTRIFEESLFLSLEKERDSSAKVYEWRKFVPNFFSHELYKAMKMQAELKAVRDPNDRKNMIIDNRRIIPAYLICFYYREGTLKKEEIELLSTIFEKENESSSFKNAGILLVTESMSPEQRVDYALKEICKNSVNLEDKEFLLSYANSNINIIRNATQREIEGRRNVIKQLTKTIRLQKMINQEILRLEKDDPSSPLSINTKDMVNFCVLTVPQIKKLVQQLCNPMIELVYFCSYNDKDYKINVDQRIQDILDNKPHKKLKSNEVKEKFSQMFQLFDKKDLNKIKIKEIISNFDQLAISEIETNTLMQAISDDDSSFIKKNLWVPLFLGDWGFPEVDILEHYMAEAKKDFESNREFLVQKKFLYNWISAFCFVRLKFIEGRKSFRAFNEILLEESQSNERNISDYKLLQKFLKRKISP